MAGNFSLIRELVFQPEGITLGSAKIEDSSTNVKVNIDLDSTKNAMYVQSESLSTESTLAAIKDTAGIKKIVDPVLSRNYDSSGNGITSTPIGMKNCLDVNIGTPITISELTIGDMKLQDATEETKVNIALDSTKNAMYIQSESLSKDTTLVAIKDTAGIKKITDPVEVNLHDGSHSALTSTLVNTKRGLDVSLLGGDLAIGAVELKNATDDTRVAIELDSTKNSLYVKSESLAKDSSLSTVNSNLGDVKSILALGATEATVSAISGNIVDIENKIATESTLSAASNTLTSINTNVAKETTLTNLYNKVNTLDTRVGTVNTNLDSIETKLDTINTNVAKESTLSNIETDIGTINTNIGTINNNLDSIETKLDTTNSILAKESTLSTISGNIVDIENKVATESTLTTVSNNVVSINNKVSTEATLLSIKNTDGIKKIVDNVNINVHDDAGNGITSTLINAKRGLDINVIGCDSAIRANQTLFTSQVLTASYVYSASIDTSKSDTIILYLTYNKGDETSFSLRLRFSHDGTNWYDYVYEVLANPIQSVIKTYTYTASLTYRLSIPVADMYMRVGIIAVGGTPTGTVSIVATKSHQ